MVLSVPVFGFFFRLLFPGPLLLGFLFLGVTIHVFGWSRICDLDSSEVAEGGGAESRGEVTTQANTAGADGVRAHPLAELLECPPQTGDLLTGSAERLDFEGGEPVFRQNAACKGLYLLISGVFVRKAERLKARLTLEPARAGELVELAAALGDRPHTYTLRAATPGTALLLPIEALQQAFESHPPLRMRLLEELAREVSRAYIASSTNRALPKRRRVPGTSPA